MAAPRASILPPRVDFIHKESPPIAAKGVKMNKGVAYTYANGRSTNNNIEKGGGVVQLPFLYQAPSVRQGTSTVAATHLKGTNTNHRRKNSRKAKRDSSVHLPQLPNLPPPSAAFDNGDFDISQLVLRGSLKPLNPKASTSSSEAVPTTRTNHRPTQNHLSNDRRAAEVERRTTPYTGLRQNGIIVNASDSTCLPPLLSVTLPQRAKSANDVREESPSRSNVNHLHAPVIQSLSTQCLRETAERATQTVMYQAVASVEYLDKAKVSTATPYHFRRKSEMQPSDEVAEEKDLLMGVIEDALGETFDRYSRQRTSQLIARNARKQAEIWRDAKDFIMGSLIPQSIQVANKSRRRQQTAAEIVGNIKIYP